MDNTQAHALLTAEEELRHDEAVQQLNNEVVRTEDQHLVNEASSMKVLLPKQTNDNVIVGTTDNDKVAKEVNANLRKRIKKSDFSSAPIPASKKNYHPTGKPNLKPCQLDVIRRRHILVNQSTFSTE